MTRATLGSVKSNKVTYSGGHSAKLQYKIHMR